MSTTDTWKQLETGPSGTGGGYLSRRIHPGAVVDLFLAMEKPSNTRLLVVRVAGTTLKPDHDLPRAEGFEVRRGFETVDGKKHYHLAVRLTHPRFADVFATLVDDVVSHVVRATGEAAAVRALLDRLERWQSFLKRHAGEGLDNESQQGLYGELWFLGRHAIPRLGTRVAVDCWKGPTGAPQDFHLPAVSVEVKTASGKQHQNLAISNERQLDPVGVGAMFSRAGSSIYWPGGGAGGLITDMSGMLAWGSALLRDHQPVGEATWTRMSQLDPNTALGAGAMGLCPCQGGFFWVGHTGGTTALFYDRSDNVLIALRIANGIWGAFEDPFVELVESLRITALSL